jgi:hypothetical protein
MHDVVLCESDNKHRILKCSNAKFIDETVEHFAGWYRADLLLGSRLPVSARTGRAGLLAGFRVYLPSHAGLYTNRKVTSSV